MSPQGQTRNPLTEQIFSASAASGHADGRAHGVAGYVLKSPARGGVFELREKRASEQNEPALSPGADADRKWREVRVGPPAGFRPRLCRDCGLQPTCAGAVYSGLIFAALITGHHFSISAR